MVQICWRFILKMLTKETCLFYHVQRWAWEKVVFFFFFLFFFRKIASDRNSFLRNFVYSLFQKSGPLVFWAPKRKYSINFCDSYIFKKVRTVQFFWCVNKENSLKNEVDYFLQNACAVSSSSRSSSPSLYYALPWKPSFSLHISPSPWNPSSRGNSPNYICDLNPPSLSPLILRNRSNDLFSPHCQPSRHFVFKDKLRSKNVGKVKVLICWHHVTLSNDRLKFCWSQTFKIWLKLPLKVPPF